MKHSSFIKFLLQFIFLAKVANLILPTLAAEESWLWLIPITESIIYIAIGIFLLRSENFREEYKIGILPLILFILFGTVFRNYGSESGTFEVVFQVFEWLIAGILLIRIITKKITLPPIKYEDIKWAAIGAVVGMLLAIPLSYFYIHLSGYDAPPVDTRPYTVLLSIFQFLFINGKSAIVEEIIFRGLLFGYLTKQSGNEKQAFLIQFMLFWGFHFHYLWLFPPLFWVSIPLSTFVFSMLFLRSRSLSSSILAHMFSNTFLTIFLVLITN